MKKLLNCYVENNLIYDYILLLNDRYNNKNEDKNSQNKNIHYFLNTYLEKLILKIIKLNVILKFKKNFKTNK